MMLILPYLIIDSFSSFSSLSCFMVFFYLASSLLIFFVLPFTMAHQVRLSVSRLMFLPSSVMYSNPTIKSDMNRCCVIMK